MSDVRGRAIACTSRAILMILIRVSHARLSGSDVQGRAIACTRDTDGSDTRNRAREVITSMRVSMRIRVSMREMRDAYRCAR